MSREAVFGTACKTCRRRGRKCDRTLPTCMSCRNRGVLCEGYVTRWVGVAARGKLAGQTSPVSDDRDASCPRQPVSTRSRLPSRRTNFCRGKPPNPTLCHKAITPSTPGVHTGRVFDESKDDSIDSSPSDASPNEMLIRRRRSWNLPIHVTRSCDNLEGLIGYCTRTPCGSDDLG